MVAGATSLWLRRRINSPIAHALLLSVVIHLAVFGLLDLISRLGLWQNPNWIARAKAALLREPIPPPTPRQSEPLPVEQQISLIFVDVEPSQAAAEAPKETPYYSMLNSKAANPDTSVDSTLPKIDGEQTQIVKATDTPLPPLTPPKPAPLQPAPPPEPREEQSPEVAKASPPPKSEQRPPPGDLAMAKPSLRPVPKENSSAQESVEVAAKPPERPRRLADLPKSVLAGRKMKQEGGVKRYALEPSFDVRQTEFGTYDAAIIAAIQHHWYGLLDSNAFARDRTGKVVLDFHLNHDGRITQMRVVENTVGEILSTICQRAVLDPSPFGKWPADMRRMVGNTYREVRFTFYYN